MPLTTLPDVSTILQVPCVVYVSPSALDTEANYGTLVGNTEGPVQLTCNIETRLVTKEPRGVKPVKETVVGIWWEIRMRLAAHSSAALDLAFPGMASGTDVRHPGAADGAGLIAGTDLASATYAKQVLIMPIDECAVNPCALIQHGAARITKTPVDMASTHDLIYDVMIRTFEKPGNSTNVYRDFFLGNKANATILS